ncbi:N-6 DNA methylase [Kitasatospora sp. NPDC001540]|uniref:N-6 DNA methylase n=1 Tax=Kitasatospora sp. NPDC001540 TaxID=3364014 RepID=UPI0036A76595
MRTAAPSRRPALLPGRTFSRGNVQRLGEAVAQAWHTTPYSSRTDIPLSIVASLALIPVKDHPADVARTINEACDEHLVRGLREVWVHHWAQRPELAPALAPLMAWLTEKVPADLAHSVRKVVDACLQHGLLEMTGSSDPGQRSEVDVLSWTLTELRSPGARQRLGEFHTPPQVSDLMAKIAVDGLPPAGERFLEPAGGSGGLFQALAQRLRELGGDPGHYEWVLVELDGLAAAAAAVNAIVWGLGPRVVVARGDALQDPQVAERAAAARTQLRGERDRILAYVSMVEGIRAGIDLAEAKSGEIAS